ncbi:MAG TPA: hypothetical protein VMR37_02030 [Rhabdochlamydiaceae bacterium]|nr:hypothetical protein [Rhabdochlamydiaceae bacterium]
MNTVKRSSILSIWLKPREGVRYLETASHFLLITGLTLIYFVQISTFVLSLEKLTIAPLLTYKGVTFILLFLLALGLWTFTFIQAFTMTVWSVAKRFNGQGTIPQTRAAVIGVLAWFMPLGFFWLIIYFTNRQPDAGLILQIIRIAAYLGGFATLLYGIVVMLKTVSEAHSFGLWRSLFSISISTLILYGIIRAVLACEPIRHFFSAF